MYHPIRPLLLVLTLSLPAVAAVSQQDERRDIGFQAMEPFQIFDNLYFVGIKAVASYVIETSDGLILIDTLDGFDGFTDQLLDNIRKVGLDSADIKYVLILQSHRDHYGGARELQPRLDAVFGSSEEDWQVINHHDIHATGADDLFARAKRLEQRRSGEPNPWVAPDEFQRWLDELIADSYERLARVQ